MIVRADARPHVLFLGVTYVGHGTRFQNLRRHAEADDRIRTSFHEVRGWQPDGRIERTRVLPLRLRTVLRTVVDCAAIAAFPRPDVLWTSAGDAIAPYLWSQVGPLARPLIVDLDWTLEQQEAMSSPYYGRPPRSGTALALRRVRRAAVSRAVSVFTPWSEWAATALRETGVPDSRIRVIPPGVDLDLWPARRRDIASGRALRVLFVGGDFVRKGGQDLVDVVSNELRGRCELDVVTRAPVPTLPGIRAHRLEPNSPGLRELFAAADVFVMPTRAETFGIATIEAMASGLPVIVTDVGAAREIVDDGVSGWVIAPGRDSLSEALSRAVTWQSALPTMGKRGAAVARRRFDGRRNDAAIVELALDLAARRRVARARVGTS